MEVGYDCVVKVLCPLYWKLRDVLLYFRGNEL